MGAHFTMDPGGSAHAAICSPKKRSPINIQLLGKPRIPKHNINV